MNYGRTYAQIDLSAICHNVDAVKHKIPQGVRLLVVIKADAYGHGAVESRRVNSHIHTIILAYST